VFACFEMKKRKTPKSGDFAPLPKKRVLVEEDGFDKVIGRTLKSSSVGIYEIKTSKRGSKKLSSQ
jgi:hypothetical protein